MLLPVKVAEYQAGGLPPEPLDLILPEFGPYGDILFDPADLLLS